MKNQKVASKKSPAVRSAKRAEKARAEAEKEAEAQERKNNKEGNQYEKRVSRAAKGPSLSIYRGYKKKISEAARSGNNTCIVDSEDWSWSAGDEESKVTDEEIFQRDVEMEAKKIAQEKLKDEGYILEPESHTASTTLGSGSDPLTVGESGRQWLKISFPEKKK